MDEDNDPNHCAGNCPNRCANRCPNHMLHETHVHANCTVQILECPECGEVSIGWWKNDHPPETFIHNED